MTTILQWKRSIARTSKFYEKIKIIGEEHMAYEVKGVGTTGRPNKFYEKGCSSQHLSKENAWGHIFETS